MNERDYEELAGACDALLRAPDTSLARIALPLLHLLNEHPTLLGAYASLMGVRPLGELQKSEPSAPAGSATILRRAMRALSRTARNTHQPRLAASPGSVDVLIVSHLNSPAQLGDTRDFYFGDLQRLLAERGATSVLALVNHLPSPATVNLPDPDGIAVRILLPDALPLAAELSVWASSIGASRALLNTARRTANPLQKKLALLAGRHALSGAGVRNLRLHHSIDGLCRRLSPRIVITTYEGDASERLIWHAARQGKRQPLCVGYQHASLRARAHAIRRRVNAPGLRCDPDVVLTLGEITAASLAASEALRPVQLITYGSHRRSSWPAGAIAAERDPLCLVLPDSDPAECDVLFRFAIACANEMPAIAFLLRPHPASKFDAAALRAIDANVPLNVTLSTHGSLAQDAARARYCLYRGTSGVMEAVRAGVKPFYVARQGELSFDPLYQLDGWRETVVDPADFVARAPTAGMADLASAQRARTFCDRYVSPVRPAAIDTLLELAGVAGSTTPVQR